MKLPFFSRKFLKVLHGSVAENVGRYGSGVEWLDELSPGQIFVHESGYVVDPPPQLMFSGDDPAKFDGENAIRIHKWLRALPASTAMEERLWACLAHVTFADYMRARWPAESDGVVSRRYLFDGSSFGALARHGIARLWWAGYLTHDPTRLDPYELTKTMFLRQDVQLALMDRAIGKCATVRTAVLEFLSDNREWFSEKDFGRRIQLLMKELNLLGGVLILDALPVDQVRDHVIEIGKRVAAST
jgi:hypothetical protein